MERKTGAGGRIRRQKLILAVLCLLLCLIPARKVFSQDTSDKAESWLYLLVDSADNENGFRDCRFYGIPSAAGYEDDGELAITLQLSIGDSAYQYDLYSMETADGWYTSPELELAQPLLTQDYQVTARLEKDGQPLGEAQLARQDIQIEWPVLTDGVLELERALDGSILYDSYDRSTWADGGVSGLLTYSIENQKNCKASFEKDTDTIRISDASDGGSFELAVTDPAGSRRAAKVSIAIAAAQGAGGMKMGLAAVALIVVIVILVLVVKKKVVGDPPEAARQAREDVDEMRKGIDKLIKRMDAAAEEILEKGSLAREKIKADPPASAYTLAEIAGMTQTAEEIGEDESYCFLKELSDTFKTVSEQLLKMQGNQRKAVKKGTDDLKNPYKYLDENWRGALVKKTETEKEALEQIYNQMKHILDILEEILEREDIPFEKDITIMLRVGSGRNEVSYTVSRAARDTYGKAQPGNFSLDDLQFLSSGGTWARLPEILPKPSGIRFFSVDKDHIRVVAEEPVMIAGNGNVDRLEFSYNDKPQIVLENAVLLLTFGQ